jgi:hypothetical protein
MIITDWLINYRHHLALRCDDNHKQQAHRGAPRCHLVLESQLSTLPQIMGPEPRQAAKAKLLQSREIQNRTNPVAGQCSDASFVHRNPIVAFSLALASLRSPERESSSC